MSGPIPTSLADRYMDARNQWNHRLAAKTKAIDAVHEAYRESLEYLEGNMKALRDKILDRAKARGVKPGDVFKCGRHLFSYDESDGLRVRDDIRQIDGVFDA